jgi:membrane associated rhomboid family serine protease
LFPLKDNIPTGRLPVLTIVLIAANVLTYLLFQRGGFAFGDPTGNAYQCNVLEWGAIPVELTDYGTQVAAEECGTPPSNTILSVFTAMFMHGGLLHLGGNMLFLWIFGNNVEDRMGRARFLLFYLLGGLAALAAQVAIDPESTVPTIGASGAVAGVLGGYLLLFPRARVLTVFFLFVIFFLREIPAVIVLGIWFLQQVLFGYFDLANPTGEGGGVAYFAHIGGFVFGLVAVRLFVLGRGRAREDVLRA